MRLLALRLRHFRRFTEAAYAFDPRLNVLVGPNEAGKSTLRHAILTALYVNPATTARRREEWRPWGSEVLGSVALEFEVDGRRFELRKDFEQRKALLRDLVTGVTVEGSRAQEQVLQALGLSTDGLFRATAMIEQTEIAMLKMGATEIGQRLSRVIEAGPGHAEAGAVIRKLDKDLAELEKGLEKWAKNPGLLRRLQDEVAALQAQQEESQRRLALQDARQAERKRITADLEVAARDLQDKEALLRENRDFLAMEAQLDPLRTQERQLAERITAIERGGSRVRGLKADLETLQTQGVPDDAAVARLHEAQGAVQQQRADVARQEEAARAAVADVESLGTEPPHRAWRGVLSPVGWGAAGAGLLVAAAAVLRQFVPALAFVAVALLTGGLALLLLDRRDRRRREFLRRERETAVLRLEETRRILDAGRQALESGELALRAALNLTGSTSVEDATTRHTRLQAIVQDLKAAQSQVEALQGNQPLEHLQDTLARVRADIATREAALTRPEVQVKRLTPLLVQQLEHDVRDLTQTVHGLRARQEHLERESVERAPDYEVLASLPEHLAERQEMLDAARRRVRVYRIARDLLHEARQQTLIPARRVVEERAGQYLGLLTRGAYDRVQIEEPPLRVSVYVPAAEQWLEPVEPALSRGTADQVYLAVRLALVEVLADDKRHPPLLLDDPFGTFDPDRLRAAMTLLHRVSEANQVLLFTCRPDYEPFADRVIVLSDQPPPPEVLGPLWQPPPQTH